MHDMKNTINKKIWYVVLSVAAVILNALPMIIFRDDLAITKYSSISIAFAICSVVYAVIAFILRGKGNLFTAGHRFWRFVDYLFAETKSYTKTEDYKKEFALSAFIYCVTIPTYITFSFFANGFFSALLQALSWTIIRQIAIILIVMVPPIIKRIKEKKQQRIKDEAGRKEQERRESMGKWK